MWVLLPDHTDATCPCAEPCAGHQGGVGKEPDQGPVLLKPSDRDTHSQHADGAQVLRGPFAHLIPGSRIGFGPNAAYRQA